MPIHTGQDKNGKFYQWGKTGKKYYFKPGDEASRKRARGKAEAQQTAIYSSGWKGDTMKMKLVKVKKKDANYFQVGQSVLSKLEDIVQMLKKDEGAVTNLTGEQKNRAEVVVLSIENRMNEIYKVLRNWKKHF